MLCNRVRRSLGPKPIPDTDSLDSKIILDAKNRCHRMPITSDSDTDTRAALSTALWVFRIGSAYADALYIFALQAQTTNAQADESPYGTFSVAVRSFSRLPSRKHRIRQHVRFSRLPFIAYPPFSRLRSPPSGDYIYQR